MKVILFEQVSCDFSAAAGENYVINNNNNIEFSFGGGGSFYLFNFTLVEGKERERERDSGRESKSERANILKRMCQY